MGFDYDAELRRDREELPAAADGVPGGARAWLIEARRP